MQYIDGESCCGQDMYMLYKCLMALLTSKAKKKILIWSEQYTIGENKMSSGVALLKIIIRKATWIPMLQPTKFEPSSPAWTPTSPQSTVTGG
jgi:hypothetical protein